MIRYLVSGLMCSVNLLCILFDVQEGKICSEKVQFY